MFAISWRRRPSIQAGTGGETLEKKGSDVPVGRDRFSRAAGGGLPIWRNGKSPPGRRSLTNFLDIGDRDLAFLAMAEAAGAARAAPWGMGVFRSRRIGSGDRIRLPLFMDSKTVRLSSCPPSPERPRSSP